MHATAERALNIVTCLSLLVILLTASITLYGDEISESARLSPDQFMINPPPAGPPPPVPLSDAKPPRLPRNAEMVPLLDVRSVDGSDNNLEEPDFGSVGTAFLRLTTNAYADGLDEPSNEAQENARTISNILCDQETSVPDRKGYSDFMWVWGQFIDHDLDLTPSADPAENYDIAVPAGDPDFDAENTGTAIISVNRSNYLVDTDGVRQQNNQITTWLDGSQVYGSDENRTNALRTLDGTGRLKTSEGDLLPFNEEMLDNAPSAFIPTFFLAGDIRANENFGLTAMQTLFVREHNYWATRFADEDPELDGDTLYQMARKVVGAEIQAITYREFLPELIGKRTLPRYRGYKPEVDATISNVFATAAYRFGHTQLPSELWLLNEDGSQHDLSPIELGSALFNITPITEAGIDPILRGLAGHVCESMDPYMVDGVRNLSFGPGVGFDLAAMDIQRGRDHGLPTYNQARVDFGLPPAASFEEISDDEETITRLSAAYETVDDVEIWPGCISEKPVRGGMVGPLTQRILADQFVRLRDGDRFWYEFDLPKKWVKLINKQTLGAIIQRNTGIGKDLKKPWKVSSSQRPAQRNR